MIDKKKALSRIPKNLVHEKTRLKQLHRAALSSGNETEAERIQDKLTQLEELAQGSRDKSISRENEMFLKVNERNRKMNMVEMRQAERRDAEERRRNGTQFSFFRGIVSNCVLQRYLRIWRLWIHFQGEKQFLKRFMKILFRQEVFHLLLLQE